MKNTAAKKASSSAIVRFLDRVRRPMATDTRGMFPGSLRGSVTAFRNFAPDRETSKAIRGSCCRSIEKVAFLYGYKSQGRSRALRRRARRAARESLTASGWYNIGGRWVADDRSAPATRLRPWSFTVAQPSSTHGREASHSISILITCETAGYEKPSSTSPTAPPSSGPVFDFGCRGAWLAPIPGASFVSVPASHSATSEVSSP